MTAHQQNLSFDGTKPLNGFLSTRSSYNHFENYVEDKSKANTELWDAEDQAQELGLYGIFRIDNEAKHYHGWKVMISRKNRLYHQSFSDKAHGGKEDALVAAKLFRNEIISNFPLMNKSDYVSIIKKNNTSGVAGVFRCETKSTKHKDKVHRYWCAQLISKSGERKRIKFSIEKYGDRIAFEMACAARNESLSEICSIQHANSSHHHVWLDSGSAAH